MVSLKYFLHKEWCTRYSYQGGEGCWVCGAPEFNVLPQKPVFYRRTRNYDYLVPDYYLAGLPKD